MRSIHYEHHGAVAYGIVGDGAVHELTGGSFDGARRTGVTHAAGDVRVLVPCEPTNQHVERSEGVILNAKGAPVPSDVPGVFATFPASLIADGEPIVLPADATSVHFEGELALVVGAPARDVAPERAGEYVFGRT